MRPTTTLLPILATIMGIALFSAMDAVLKSASIAIGAYSAFLIRCLMGLALIGPAWWYQQRRWPSRAAMRLHLLRGIVVAFMGWSFFFSLVRLPLAEAIAISFIAPLIALYLAAVTLGERIRRRAIAAALLGLAGVVIIVGGKIGRERMTEDSLLGLAAIIASAVLYAWSLVLQRQQALVARPAEVSTFQNGIVALVLLPAAPFLLQLPDRTVLGLLAVGAVLAVGAGLFLAWAYARAEAQVLVPVEYSGFLWAALFGWLFFAERVTSATLAGAVLIIVGCMVAAQRRAPPQPEITAL